jgi:hypothetical protein
MKKTTDIFAWIFAIAMLAFPVLLYSVAPKPKATSTAILLKRLVLPEQHLGRQAHLELDVREYSEESLVSRTVLRYVLMAKNDSIYVARIDTGRVQPIENIIFE